MATMPVIGGLFGSGDDANASLNWMPLLTTETVSAIRPGLLCILSSIKTKSLHASLALPRKRKVEVISGTSSSYRSSCWRKGSKRCNGKKSPSAFIAASATVSRSPRYWPVSLFYYVQKDERNGIG